ncbi:hypothetical protein Slin14017_G057060 [Septoria linicola]|nr:hypothetical protein Slin14017_G057060 [Septoria linicola]
MTNEGATAGEVATVLNRSIDSMQNFKCQPKSILSPRDNAPKRLHAWTIEEKETLAGLWRRGESQASMAVALGRSLASIDKALDRYGIRPRSKAHLVAHLAKSSPKPFTAEEYDLALKLRAEGSTYASIARTLGRRASSVYARLDKAKKGVEFRENWDVADAERNLIEQLRLQGKTYREIQAALPHRGFSTIFRVCKSLRDRTSQSQDERPSPE